MERTPLFRPAALAAHRAGELGRIVLVGPVTLRVFSAVFIVLAAGLAGLFHFGTYTAHRTLRGRLVTERSLIEVRSPQFGTVVEKRVSEGEAVERGDVLYVVSSERLSNARGATQREIGEKLDSRRRSLIEQIANTRVLAGLERRSLEEAVGNLAEESVGLEETAAAQVERADLAREVAERYQRIRTLGFVSEEQALAKRADLLEQQSRLHALERERATIARQVSELDGRIVMAEVRYENQVAELERSMAEIDLQLAENEARRAIVIVAPEDGIVTGIGADVGEPVDNGTPLAFIVPARSTLHAELYAPSRSAGFLFGGQDVLLRYEAFPYQKFGHHHGTVAAVSRTALAVHAFDRSSSLAGEPMYQVTVELQRQTVDAYGEARALRPGMAVEADVLLETRRLYEWVFEPLYSLAGRTSFGSTPSGPAAE
jgi:membrane fusion protein